MYAKISNLFSKITHSKKISMSLRITAIHLDNFKSWFGHHTIQLDSNKFMAIVGANGSGKSNIIDSLLFVFGWRAKQLRQAKLVDLIHYSEQQPDFARVQVDFINQGNVFSVGRIVKRNGQNNYLINDQRATLEDLTQLLKQNGLDINHNRFLILQGEVESISMMKPVGEDQLQIMTQQQLRNLQFLRELTDRLQIEFDPIKYNEIYQYINDNQQQLLQNPETQQLFSKIIPIQTIQTSSSETGLLEFIEQIVGTQDYIPGVAEQAALVQFIDIVKQQSRNQLNQLITFRDQLNKQKDEAVAAIKKFYGDYINHFNSLLYECSNARFIIQTKNEETRQHEEQIQQLQQNTSVQAVKKEIQDVENQIKHILQQISQFETKQNEIEQQLKQHEIQANLFDDQLNKKTADIENNQKKQQKLGKDIENLQQQFADLPNQLQKQNQVKESLEKTLEQLQQQLDELQQRNEDQSEMKKIQEQINQINQQLTPLTQQLAQLESQYEISKKNAVNKLDILIQHVETITVNIVAIDEIYSQKNNKLYQLQKQKNEIETQLNAIDINKLTAERAKYQEQIREHQLNINNVNLQISELNANKNNNVNQNKLLSFLIQQKINGVYGRLGDLGQIDPSLNLAAIAAFGSQLDYIVCQNMDVIQKCLDTIKQNNLGYASFLDLEQITKRFRNNSTQQPSQQFIQQLDGYLFLDLVKCDQNMKAAFWHVMGDIVVTSKTQNAIQLNRGQNGKKLRVVTQNGEIFEKSGSLTGGGTGGLLSRYLGFSNKKQGGQNEAKELKSLEKELQGLQINMTSFNTSLQEIQNRIDDYESKKQQLDQIIEQLQEQIQNQYKNYAKINALIMQIKQIDQDQDVKFCTGQVNEQIMAELNALQELLQTNEVISQKSLLEVIPNVQEIVQYYKSQGYVNQKAISKAIHDNDNLNVLIGDSDFSNLLTFNQNLMEVLNMQQTQQIEAQMREVQERSSTLQAKLDELNQLLNNTQQVKEYQKVKKQFNEVKDQQKKCEKAISDLQLLEKRFEPQNDRLVQELADLQQHFERFVQEKQQIIEQKQNLVVTITSIREGLQQTLEQKSMADGVHEQLVLQLQRKQEELRSLSAQLSRLQALIDQNTKDVQKNLNIISTSENLYKQAVEVLQVIGDELARVQETITYQLPLYGAHENTEELAAFDQYVLVNFQQFKPVLRGFAQIDAASTRGRFATEFSVLSDYERRVSGLVRQQEAFTAIQRDYEQQLEVLDKLRCQREAQFLAAFHEINGRLREIYRVFSMGGDAALELVDSFDPFQGVSYAVMPPKKAWRPIQNLSGGEKTLSSLSLIFALHQFKRNFIYVVDEIDAALDFRNVSLVANYLKRLSTECQFVIISLRNNTFEVADKLIGVYKVNNLSNVVQLDIE